MSYIEYTSSSVFCYHGSGYIVDWKDTDENMIDLFFNSYQESCDWGLKQSKVTILGDSSGK
ncbi:hypothetical protein [uncultured Clostridium sp.]|uniref:hypothetical protein n=1 Tax=uncultured Clostridium sp. TaxID=59620 RepID=UPI0025D48722|nr:hypothetical protein [uncultured Clostridium sp.]